MITIVVVSLFVLIFLGVPISFAIMLSGLISVAFTDAFPLYMTVQRFVGGINSFSLLAIPFFVFAGRIMSAGGISRRIIDFCAALLSPLRGSIAIVTVGANMIFAGISGSGCANISAIGGLTGPAMVERGYSKGFTAALVGGAGSLGPIIPPSVEMIIFASITGLSVAKMFIGGIIPGLFMGLMFIAISYFYAKAHGIDYDGGKFNPRMVWTTFKDAVWALIMPVIIVGGVISGMFTATESGSIACVYGMIVGIFVYKELKIKDLVPCFKETSKATGQVMMILAASTLYSYIFTTQDIGVSIASWLLSVTDSALGIMLVTAGVMVIIGMFMETLAAMPIILPIVFPLLDSMGCNMTQFGIMFCLCTIMGGLTPPVGVYLFLSSSVIKVKAVKVIPWMMVMISVSVIAILIAIFWPPFTTWLPGLMFD